ncbi:MAG: tRNA (adenosine(37)-N6)-dimethylallyltransferase MiaA [Desulfobulbaceae bacterium A2]|nr:MAG: tRNA (adenosine(37)-N6)-dimethylallyltransferase MiaA [Desulfobulbaceae bacterium A2]
MNREGRPGPIVVLVGPTAVGKTEISLRLAREFNCEIVSVDSMQVYRLMDIGTAKPSPAERGDIPHHLLDVVFPDQDYDAGRFAREAQAACEDIRRRGAIPLLTGGTGLYLRAWREGLVSTPPLDPAFRRELRQQLAEGRQGELFEELCCADPQTAARIHPNDSQRLVRALEILRGSGLTWSQYLQKKRDEGRTAQPLPCSILHLGLACEREELYRRIEHRCHLMLEQGLREEVAQLLDLGYGAELKSMQAIGYRHMADQLLGHCSAAEAQRLLLRDTRRYAKRQLTWFRTEPVQWYQRGTEAVILRVVANWLQQQNSETA